jgi:PmbA protein
VPVAKEGASMERDYWYTLARTPAKLEAPEFVGQEAARRALRRLGARKISTRKAPVVFEPRIARGLLGDLFEAVSGDSVYRKATFLDGLLGQKISSDLVTVIDDGTLPGLFGSSPFDDEGVPTRRTVVVEKGSLASWLLNSYTTGNCSRGLTGNGSVGSNNFYLEAGTSSPQELLRGLKGALYVTELMGQGVNIVTGDYSRGAAGMWIENGELAYPVHEITIASNLKEMLKGIVAVGNDLDFRGSIAAPTLVIGEMTISGS